MDLKIKKTKLETDSVSSYIFEKPKDLPAGRQGFSFYPGQYLDVKLPVRDKNGDTRAFTISSSPTEDFLMITTKIRISKFKKHLSTLKPGDTVSTSHPAGTFILDETEPAVFIAGGIGITPFRSIIKYAVDKKLTTPITLIYSNSDNNFLFKKELEEWQQVYSQLKTFYHNSSLNGSLDLTQTSAIADLNVNAIYYLAGPPKMVDDFEKMLKDLGVDETNIRYDRFDGY